VKASRLSVCRLPDPALTVHGHKSVVRETMRVKATVCMRVLVTDVLTRYDDDAVSPHKGFHKVFTTTVVTAIEHVRIECTSGFALFQNPLTSRNAFSKSIVSIRNNTYPRYCAARRVCFKTFFSQHEATWLKKPFIFLTDCTDRNLRCDWFGSCSWSINPCEIQQSQA
jgi:hypothetical protein